MSQWVLVHYARPDDLGLILETHMVEEENDFHKFSSDIMHAYAHNK